MTDLQLNVLRKEIELLREELAEAIRQRDVMWSCCDPYDMTKEENALWHAIAKEKGHE